MISFTVIFEKFFWRMAFFNERASAFFVSNEISSFFKLLGHTEAFHGQIDETGNCRIEGRMISLTRTIPYIAVGKIIPSMLQLSLRGERNIFEVAGVPCKGNGGTTL